MIKNKTWWKETNWTSKIDAFLNHYEISNDTHCLSIVWKWFVISFHPPLTKQIAPFHRLMIKRLVKYFNVQQIVKVSCRTMPKQIENLNPNLFCVMTVFKRAISNFYVERKYAKSRPLVSDCLGTNPKSVLN